ncbi:uncharacterized protein TrAtP1_000316 [Trichoderma atroviride]|uniref:uncharacterized protein n=1 Tax=Hypocrea atroviridis TaxID=63577 RepID=UPI003331157C|nr:hypothetical protein TrAtP1_000316 [Trichoderma atroviride]
MQSPADNPTMSGRDAADYSRRIVDANSRCGWKGEGAEDVEVHRETSKYIQIAWRLDRPSLFAARR